MRILISGVCGFVGSTLARGLSPTHTLVGFDNFSRAGSETNTDDLRRRGVTVIRADARFPAEMDALPACDWVIDAAANPSVLAGVQGASSRDVMEHNLWGTVNLLEYAKRHRAGFTLLSTSRVYGLAALESLPLGEAPTAFRMEAEGPGFGPAGLREEFSTTPPLSLYGTSKLASEAVALEYGAAFDFPVFVNRCGLLAGAGQFGRADQGIVTWWIHRWRRRLPLRYLGFGGSGRQVRDCLHPRDLLPVLERQFAAPGLALADRTVNLSGGAASARSLRDLSDWCARRFGPHDVAPDGTPRRFDAPWIVLDSGRAERTWNWRPTTPVEDIWEEIARHAEAHPQWLELTG